jgi:cytochrome c-type biogenesis protein
LNSDTTSYNTVMGQHVSILIAFGAGVLSFLSPCVLPLIPSYLSLVGGISVQELSSRGRGRAKVLGRTALFVLGFSVVFIALGVLFSATGGLLSRATRIINIVAGSLVILLGLNFIFNFWDFLNYEKRIHVHRAQTGFVGALLLGMAFGAGWTPCVGPILASILFFAGASGQVLQGTLLLAVYSLGLGLPFLAAGLFFSQFLKQRERIKSRLSAIRIGSGIFLVFIGLLILLGRLQRFNSLLFRLASGLQRWSQASPWEVRITFAVLFLLPAVVLGISYWKKIAAEGRFRVLPGRLIAAALFALLAALTLFGVVRPAGFFISWLTYQGI